MLAAKVIPARIGGIRQAGSHRRFPRSSQVLARCARMDNETFFDNGREYYKATNRRVWPHRDREHPSAQAGDEEHLGALIDTKYVRLMLERLDELEKKTRPSASSGDVAEGKDLAAREAMTTVAHLVRYAAGWAIDHQVGLAIEGLEFVPL